MDGIAITVIVVYLVGATAAGSFMARRAKSSAGWAVAGGGMSTGLIYEPGRYSTTDQIVDLARDCADFGALYTSQDYERSKYRSLLPHRW